MKDLRGRQNLQEVYCTFRDMYGVMHHSWDMTHDINRYPVIWDNDFDLFHEYEVWKALLPIFKQHDVAYYLGIDDFVKNYGAWLRRKYAKTT